MKTASVLAGGLCLLSAVFCFSADDAAEETVFHKQVRETMSASGFRRKGSHVWEILDKNGAKAGTLYLETVDDSRRKMGFGGTIEIAIVVNGKDEICGILIGRNQETPRFLKRVKAAGFLEKWNGMTLKKAAETDMDTVTRATYSSSAIAFGVKQLAASLIGDDAEK